MTAARGVGEATLFPGYFGGSMPRNSSGVGLTQLQTKLSASPRIIQGNSSWREIKINGCSPKRNPSFSASLELLSSLIIPKKIPALQFCPIGDIPKLGFLRILWSLGFLYSLLALGMFFPSLSVLSQLLIRLSGVI